MAIYHLTATIVSRGRGQSVVAAAAYRTGTALRDERYGGSHNYVGKRGVTHTEIRTPSAAPPWANERQTLWNAVEAAENRKDAQLARLVEVGLPVELSADERLALIRDYVDRQFVGHGMIADFAIRGEATNPHAHILLTLRTVSALGFGPKERRWNGKAVLQTWRSEWAQVANLHLARAGHDVRIDHRTLEAQQIELAPGLRIGVGRGRRGDATLPRHLADRFVHQQRIARENGEMIGLDPTVALRALTHQRPVFTSDELARFLRSRTDGPEQFDAVLSAVLASPDCVALEGDAPIRRFTSRDMIDAEASLMRRASAMAARTGHALKSPRAGATAPEFATDDTLGPAFDYLVADGDAKAIAVTPAACAVLEEAVRLAWRAEGWRVLGSDWQSSDEPLDRNSVVVQGTCHLLGLKDLERVLAAADHARAKVVLIADADQLRAMKVVTPFGKLQSLIGR